MSVAQQTFAAAVDAIVKHRKANPRHALETARNVVEAELDNFTEKRLIAQYGVDGSSQWVQGTGLGVDYVAPPFSHRPRSAPAGAVAAVKKLGAGVGLVRDWLGEGLRPIPKEEAESRAAICAVCQLNQEASITEWAYSKVAGGLKMLMEVRDEMKLSTSRDAELKTCKACSCALVLKVHAPMEHIKAHTTPDIMAALDDKCWVRKG